MEIQANRTSLHRGFSLVELIAVIAIILVLAGVAAPNFIRALYNARLRGAGNDIASMVQLCRIRAVQDSRYYGVYLHAGSGTSPQEVFVDIYPQNVNGASGSGGLTIDPKDPVAVIPAEVTQQSPTSAPNTTGLAQLLLPTNPNSLVPTDGSSIATPITFGPEGLPCKPLAVTGGTVCNSRGGGRRSGLLGLSAGHQDSGLGGRNHYACRPDPAVDVFQWNVVEVVMKETE